MEYYKKSYKQLVAYVGVSLKTADIDQLDYFHKDSLIRARAHADTPWTGLRLLRALEEAGVFSDGSPEGLASAMGEVKREDLKKTVEDFVHTNRQIIACGVRGVTVLETGTMATTTVDRDGPYYRQQLGKAPAIHEEDSDDGYTKFIPTSRVPDLHSQNYDYSPQSSISSSTANGGQTTTSSDDDDEVYSYVMNREDWLTTAPTPQWKLSQKMRLLTHPLKTMVRRQENHTLTSKRLEWQPVHSLAFKLHIDPLGSHDGIAATLRLLKQVKTDIFFTVELTVSLPRRNPSKKTAKNKLYEGTSTSALVLFQSCVVMDMADETTPTGPSVVARFPMILSHKNLTNRKLVKAPFLDLSLTIRQFNT